MRRSRLAAPELGGQKLEPKSTLIIPKCSDDTAQALIIDSEDAASRTL